MDERELKRLFQDAADDAPPASFDLDEVTSASRRATARHRMRVAAVMSITTVVLGGAGVIAVTSPFSDTGENATSAVSAPGQAGAPEGQPERPDVRLEGGDSRGLESEPSKQGDGEPLGMADKLGSASTERCKQVDRELATALADELPVAPDPAEPVPGQLCSRDGDNAAYRVTDGEASGLIMVVHLPERSETTVTMADGPVVATARTSAGGLVVVASVPAGDSAAPFAGELQRIADAIAAAR